MHNGTRAKDEGRIRRHARFASRYLSTPRDLVVYLPPGYDTSDPRYPVFYLQDGQNLFDPATAFGGQDWRADVTTDELIRHGLIQPLILVGIYNTGVRRVSEYTPTRDPGSRKGGKAERYAQMLAREVKPFIDREYRTLKPASQAGLGGSSLGGIVSLTSGLPVPRGFRKDGGDVAVGVVGSTRHPATGGGVLGLGAAARSGSTRDSGRHTRRIRWWKTRGGCATRWWRRAGERVPT